MKTKTKTVTTKTPAPAKAPAAYAGAPIPATKVYRRYMPEFKNTVATTWILFDEIAGVVVFANTYGTGDQLKASYDPTPYRFAYKPKVHDPKMEAAVDVPVHSWPNWITNAAGASKRRGRPAKAT